MGSLMAGWDSHVRDPKSKNLQRNMSLTKEEIASYWRSNKNKEVNVYDGTEKIYGRLNSLPVATNEKENIIIKTYEEEKEEELPKKHGWWIDSKWAFLNEPPVISSEVPFNYTSQFRAAYKHINATNPHSTTN